MYYNYKLKAEIVYFAYTNRRQISKKEITTANVNYSKCGLSA